MHFVDNIPIYLQIKDILNRRIISNEYELGSQLPSVRQLAVQFSANSNTVQKALKEMTDEHIITPRRGKGNFITSDEEIIAEMKEHIVTEMFDTTYEKLRSLNMNDQEIVASFNSYVKKRDEKNE
ncbi:GntR family transcriptional regulator [Companilactobacillus suantsaicola]|uniref:GntR family transcriptional regulator n=2 Tax=Companilactobacillus suantsaicola TaxID=2487723 RepID=A0A4Z0JGY8_9LACO|nr:GntR family transcriptional regulator [Companilactobacillus suantsaicola]